MAPESLDGRVLDFHGKGYPVLDVVKPAQGWAAELRRPSQEPS